MITLRIKSVLELNRDGEYIGAISPNGEGASAEQLVLLFEADNAEQLVEGIGNMANSLKVCLYRMLPKLIEMVGQKNGGWQPEAAFIVDEQGRRTKVE